MRNNPPMTPQRWKGAGVVFLVIAVLLIIGALLSTFGLLAPAVYNSPGVQFVPATFVFGPTLGVLRGVVLGCFAGVSFFVGLACFLWSGIAEAKEQRAEILVELAALRANADRTGGADPAEGG